jgi:hypothetical protein
MTRTFYLLGVLAILGASDTLYFHEWRAKLPGWESAHGLNSNYMPYGILFTRFCSAPFLGLHGRGGGQQSSPCCFSLK